MLPKTQNDNERTNTKRQFENATDSDKNGKGTKKNWNENEKTKNKTKKQFCQRNLMKYIVFLLSMNIAVMAIIIIIPQSMGR